MENVLIYVVAALVLGTGVLGFYLWKMSKRMTSQEAAHAEEQAKMKEKIAELEDGVGQQGKDITDLNQYADNLKAYHEDLALASLEKQKRLIVNFAEELDMMVRDNERIMKFHCAGFSNAAVQQRNSQLLTLKGGLMSYAHSLPLKETSEAPKNDANL